MATTQAHVTHVVHVDLGYGSFSLTVRDGWITAAPPVAYWTVGRRLNAVALYCQRHHGTAGRLVDTIHAEGMSL
jgi:hypothetical protein